MPFEKVTGCGEMRLNETTDRSRYEDKNIRRQLKWRVVKSDNHTARKPLRVTE